MNGRDQLGSDMRIQVIYGSCLATKSSEDAFGVPKALKYDLEVDRAEVAKKVQRGAVELSSLAQLVV